MNSKSVVIVTTKRTPLGSFQGQFTSSSASDLGSLSIDTAIKFRTLRAAFKKKPVR